MIVLLSPAKTLDMTEASAMPQGGNPRGAKDADALVQQLSKLDQAQLKALLKVSDAITRSKFPPISARSTAIGSATFEGCMSKIKTIAQRLHFCAKYVQSQL